MTHDVFISHSTLDKLAADAVCHGLEARGVRCWMAPRDQIAGKAYGQQITEAIRDAQVMVLVFSEHVNDLQAVLNEINLAAAASVTIVPFRIASVAFNPELNYYLGRTHWLDAFPQPVDAYIDALATTVQRNLPPHADAATGPAAAAAGPDVAAAPLSPPSPPAGPAAAPAGVAAHAAGPAQLHAGAHRRPGPRLRAGDRADRCVPQALARPRTGSHHSHPGGRQRDPGGRQGRPR